MADSIRDGVRVDASGDLVRDVQVPQAINPRIGQPEPLDARYVVAGPEHTPIQRPATGRAVHATGHKSRLDREGVSDNGSPFGGDTYGREELIAEMGAAFLCGICGIEQKTLANSSAYIRNWMNAIRGDTRLVVTAASAAQKAADYILGATAMTAERDDARTAAEIQQAAQRFGHGTGAGRRAQRDRQTRRTKGDRISPCPRPVRRPTSSWPARSTIALQQWGQDPVPADTLIRDVAKAIATAFAEKGGDPQFSLERFLALVETGAGRP